MAVTSLCAEIQRGQDLACTSLDKRYYQQAIIINKNDIATYNITIDSKTGKYHVKFSLKEGKKGYLYRAMESGSSFSGSFDKSTTDQGMVQYLHKTNMIIQTADAEGKLAQHELDRGSFVVAMQFKTGGIEIYGMDYGLSSADYTNDLQANNGVNAIVLQSLETAQENSLPLIYESETPGGETADFDSLFENKAA
ncbi:hypothetical protein ETU08_07530 [Apibacter muscae]|uniref:hypothetical protein n=1 Tax=Apibacter muscae TaxID=2509004 RepID=UPI0011ABBA8F|nr:hypothetical protein [Apibacter muscae]TWP29343.1 hypothetical protein ETU08_07530 [Apibacter muscae]